MFQSMSTESACCTHSSIYITWSLIVQNRTTIKNIKILQNIVDTV